MNEAEGTAIKMDQGHYTKMNECSLLGGSADTSQCHFLDSDNNNYSHMAKHFTY